jgi:hypothetical protein
VPTGIAGAGWAALALSTLLIAACGGGSGGGGGGKQASLPPEVFRFTAEPISFSPLGKPWSRNRPVLKQGLTGVHFDLDRGRTTSMVSAATRRAMPRADRYAEPPPASATYRSAGLPTSRRTIEAIVHRQFSDR